MDEQALVTLLAERTAYSSRLEFLYKIVEDTQNTIRFLDTKAAFCVTLLTAMMAAALQFGHQFPFGIHVHRAVFAVFAILSAFSLAVSLRVIFPTIHLQGSFAPGGAASPSFFLAHKSRRHWVLNTFSDHVPNLLAIGHDGYVKSVFEATDESLIRSMCDEVITVSHIRQVKSDRLHLAILSLAGTAVFFFLQTAI